MVRAAHDRRLSPSIPGNYVKIAGQFSAKFGDGDGHAEAELLSRFLQFDTKEWY
jgi:hypothetical protein